MSTASRSRRPVMATPPPKARANANTYTIEEKQQLLDNFDLEVEDKIRAFESHLALTLQSFVLRQDSELFRIPRELRTMTLRDLQASWGGSLGETVKKMKRERIEQEEKERMEREEEERKLKENEARKRKLEGEENSPGRSKNARKEGKASGSTNKGVKRKPPTKKGKSAPSRTSSAQPSTLPQNHVFDPLLPPTPKMPRAPRRGESFMSINGSPLAQPASASDEEEEGDSDDDLPDPTAYEAKLNKSQARAKPIKNGKRGPSLLFRQSLARPKEVDTEGEPEAGMSTISLKDGRVIAFNPLNLSPGRIEDEMRESGMADQEREVARARIKEEVVKALSERMERWSGLG